MLNRSTVLATLCVWLITLPLSTLHAEVYTPPPPIPSDMRPIPMPAFEGAPDDFATAVEYEFIHTVKNSLNPARLWRHITGNPKQALNVDAFDRVPDNSWFTNRMGFADLAPERIARGPLDGPGPDTTRPWIIKRAKAEGVTPGFHIKDARGDRYVIKFDPIGYGGLNSGADALGAKFFWAAGYNAPQNYITWFDPAILQLDPDGVTFTDEEGKERRMTDEDLAAVIERVNVDSDGRIQCLASQYIEGSLLGPFQFRKTREDDPNDFVPHQHRRELRGQKAIAVWVNHYDAKGANSMDTYVGVDGEGHVVHYMMDFGTILGSGGRGPYPFYRGYEDEIATGATLRRIFSFGLAIRDYEKPDTVLYPSVGRFRNTSLDPDAYRTVWPNPAYLNASDRDMYWGTRIVTAFSDDHIRAIVETGPYPPEGVDYLVATLSERRDILGRIYFDRINCLDDFTLHDERDRPDLRFTDLWIDRGYGSAATYHYRWADEDGRTLAAGVIDDPVLPVDVNPSELGPHDQAHLTLSAAREDADPGPEVTVYLHWSHADLSWELLGLEREE